MSQRTLLDRRWRHRLGAIAAASVAMVVAVLAPAAPAQAHDVGGIGATNFHTSLAAVTPVVAGLTVAVIENGSRLELRNATGTEVVIAGYGGEPYARVGPRGVFVNDNSPATYLNANRFSTTPVPPGVDPSKPPSWRFLGAEPVLRWHDHRIHWMLNTLPPAVAADPGAPHQVSSWTISLTYGGAPLTVAGSLDWLPGPNPWPWLALVAIVIAAVAAVPMLTRPHRVLAAIALIAVGAEIVHGVGVMLVEVGSVPQRIGALFGSDALLVWPFALFAAWLLWKGHTRALWIAAAAGLIMSTTLVIDDAPVWWRSSAPTALPETLNRLLVAIVVGTGVGLLAALPTLLRRHAPPTRDWQRPAGLAGSASPAGRGPELRAEPEVGAEPELRTEPDVGAEPELRTEPDVGAGPELGAEPELGLGSRKPAPVGAVGRRQVAGALAAGALGAIAGAAAGATYASSRPTTPAPTGTPLADVGARTIAFRADRQPGIVTPARPQARAWIAGLDLAPGVDRAALIGLLRKWSEAAEALMAGRSLKDADNSVVAGLGPSALTVTVGFGPSLFGRAGIPASARPAALAPLPVFAGERLDASRSDGDLGLVVAGDDPVVVVHAARVLRRLAAGVASVRWQMSGFNAARGSGPEAATPRNLMGQVDGTNNPNPTDPDFAAKIFADGPAWMRGGSYLVVRRIRMLLDDWDRVGVADQERVIGRRKDSGAPMSGGAEFTPANFGARTGDGRLAIPEQAHIRLAAPAFNGGAAMLRRGFNFADEDSSGLLFLAWQADPRRGFIPVQRRLVATDALSRFIRHETSALFAMPGGAGATGYVGQGLLEG